MAFAFVTRHVFNEHLHKWIAEYNKSIKTWNDQPERQENEKISAEIRRYPLKLELILEKLIAMENRITKGQIQTTEEHESKITMISQLFLDSFRELTLEETRENINLLTNLGNGNAIANSNNNNLNEIEQKSVTSTKLKYVSPHKQLKSKDRNLLTNPLCLFMRQIQIITVWNKIWSPRHKTDFFKWLNSTYMLIEIFHVIPQVTIGKLQIILQNLHQALVVEKKEFDKIKFTLDCEQIIEDLKIEDVNRMSDFFWRFVMSEDTPIFSFIPQEHHSMLNTAREFLAGSSGQQEIMSKFSPYVNEFKNKLNGTGIDIDINSETGQINLNDQNQPVNIENMSEEEKRAFEQKERANKRFLLHSIIDMVGSMIEKHRGIVQQLIDDPTNAFSVIKREFGPMIKDMVISASLRRMGLNKTEDEIKKEKLINEKKYLQGIGQLQRRR